MKPDKFDFESIDSVQLQAAINKDNDEKLAKIQDFNKTLDNMLQTIDYMHKNGEFDMMNDLLSRLRMLPFDISQMNDAAQVKVTEKCRDGYNAMCQEVQGAFASTMKSRMDEWAADFKKEVSGHFDALTKNWREVKEHIATPPIIFYSFIGIFAAMLISLALIFYVNLTQWDDAKLWRLLLYPNGIALAETIALNIIHFYRKRE